MATDGFNSYHEWLGRDRRLLPPNYYELLGIHEREEDAVVISAAAVTALTRVRRARPGARAAEWARLLDEIVAAKKCLTDPVKRAAYDQGLLGWRIPAGSTFRRPVPRSKSIPVTGSSADSAPQSPAVSSPLVPPRLPMSAPVLRPLPDAPVAEPLDMALSAWTPTANPKRRFTGTTARSRGRNATGWALSASIASFLAVTAIGIVLAVLISGSYAAPRSASISHGQATEILAPGTR